MGRIKILQFPMANEFGGKTQYVLNNWKFINKDRFQFDFATRSKDLHFKDEVMKEGCKVHFITCSAEQNREQFIKEFSRILDEGYDVVHLHTSYWKSYIAEELAKQYGIPKIIIHAHSSMVNLLNDQDREAANRLHYLRRSELTEDMATDFAACSYSAAEWLFGNRIPKEKIQILKNYIDINRFMYNEKIRKEYRKKLNVENSFAIGHVGRFTYVKNHEFLINVFKDICDIIPEAKLVLVGVGELEEFIQNKVYDLKIQGKVLFLNKRSDIDCLLQAFDMFMFPSYNEGLGMALIEAQASGLKCLTNETITKEVKVTDNIEFLPLNIPLWVDKAIHCSKGYSRENEEENIIKAGYDIRTQIKEIERLYSSGL